MYSNMKSTNRAISNRRQPPASFVSNDPVENVIYNQFKAKIVSRGLSDLEKNINSGVRVANHVKSWLAIAKHLTNDTLENVRKFESLDLKIRSKARNFLLGSKGDHFNPKKIEKMKQIVIDLFSKIKDELNNNIEERIYFVMSEDYSAFDDVGGFMIETDHNKKRIFFPVNVFDDDRGDIENQGISNAMAIIHEISHYFGTKDYWYNKNDLVLDNKPNSINSYLQRFIAIANSKPAQIEQGADYEEVKIKSFTGSKGKRMSYILNNAANVQSLPLIFATDAVKQYLK